MIEPTIKTKEKHIPGHGRARVVYGTVGDKYVETSYMLTEGVNIEREDKKCAEQIKEYFNRVK